jgi:hypothetical protein
VRKPPLELNRDAVGCRGNWLASQNNPAKDQAFDRTGPTRPSRCQRLRPATGEAAQPLFVTAAYRLSDEAIRLVNECFD